MKDNNLQRRKHRTYLRIKEALNKYRCLFLTISFNDKTLSKTNEQTRERYIKNYLNNETAFYIANKDFGSKNKREHYHAFIVATTLTKADFKSQEYKQYKIKNQINLRAWKYGSLKAEFIASHYVIKGDKNYKQTAKFLSEHFYKETTNKSRIIVSRKIPTKQEQKERIERLLNDKYKESIKASNNSQNDKDFLEQEIKEMSDFSLW